MPDMTNQLELIRTLGVIWMLKTNLRDISWAVLIKTVQNMSPYFFF